jgi:hypothetical protein
MAASVTAARPRYATPAHLREAIALASARRVAAACRDYARIPESVCRAMATALLDDLGAAGLLAPLPGERDKRLADLLGEVETALDQKNLRRRLDDRPTPRPLEDPHEGEKTR